MDVGKSYGRRQTMLAGGVIAAAVAVVLASPSGCFIESDGLSFGGGSGTGGASTGGMTTTGSSTSTGGMTTTSTSSTSSTTTGTGGCTTAADCPGGGACTILSCSNNVCGSQKVATGMSCTTGTGVCDANGSCVACTTSPAAGCTGSQYCYNATCASCGDGTKDGDETDSDCGGTHCTTLCGAGKGCNVASDCQAALFCESNVCRVPHSCSELHTAQPSLPDGVYSIDFNGSTGQTQVFCDMTTAGGGWTALVNPVMGTLPSTVSTLMSTPAITNGASGCSSAVQITQGANGSWSLTSYACGNATIQLTLAWANPLMAKDVMFSAVVQGDTAHTISVNGAMISSDASDTGANCFVWNGNGTVPNTTTANTCWNAAVVAPAHVYTGALNMSALSMVISAGPGSMGPNNMPNINYGTGMTIQKLAVR